MSVQFSLSFVSILPSSDDMFSDDMSCYHRLLETGNFADAVIICGQKSWNVHKIIICSRCDWFRKALDGNFEVRDTTLSKRRPVFCHQIPFLDYPTN